MNLLDTQNIINLYEKYKDELLELEDNIRGFLTKDFIPQFSDIEAEITYMLLRETRPHSVVEFSPCYGYSTVWILQALQVNDKGTLHSFDLINNCEEYIPEDLKSRLVFIQGDVKNNLHKFPEIIDYLFIDSDHSKEFCQWYIENVFPMINNIYVSVHDVLKRHPSGRLYYGEARKILEWTNQNNIYCSGFSTKYDIGDIPLMDRNARQVIDNYKETNKFSDVNIHGKGQRNSAIFFRMGR